MKIRVYAWIEFIIWLIILSVAVLGFRYHNFKSQKQYKNYQIFLDDVDGLIVGSPVKFLGFQIGYVKEIKIISSEVYVRFIITQKGLVLPEGVIATVEGSGLGGSKALEIYPPDKNNKTDKIIVSKSPTRLGKVISLFDDIFKQLNSILMTVNNTSNQLEEEKRNIKIQQSTNAQEGLIKIENKVEEIQESKDEAMNKILNKQKKDNKNENNEHKCADN